MKKHPRKGAFSGVVTLFAFFDYCFYHINVLLGQVVVLVEFFVGVDMVKLARGRSGNESPIMVGQNTCQLAYVYQNKEPSKLAVYPRFN